jgi:hypothetical protein
MAGTKVAKPLPVLSDQFQAGLFALPRLSSRQHFNQIRFHGLIMNKTDIAATLREEIGQLEVSINKLQGRCERLKAFVLDLEAEIAGPQKPAPVENSKFRKVIDQVFGEKPKRPKR